MLDIVFPVGLVPLSAPSVLPLTPPLESMCSVRWMAASICNCIGQALAEPLGGKLYQAPVSKHILASEIVSGFGVCILNGFPGRAVFTSVSAALFVPIFLLERNNSELIFLRWVGDPIPQPGQCLTSEYGLFRFSLPFVEYFS